MYCSFWALDVLNMLSVNIKRAKVKRQERIGKTGSCIRKFVENLQNLETPKV